MSQFNTGRYIGSKGKIEIHAGIAEFYKYFEAKNTFDVASQVFNKVLGELNQAIAEAIMYENYEFKMPGRLGFISVIKKKHKLKLDENGKVDTRYLPVDFQKTRELWKKIYPGKTETEIMLIPDRKRVFYQNKHSDGFIYSWFYNKYTSNATNKSVYYFKPTRTHQRALAKHVKSEDFDGNYFEY